LSRPSARCRSIDLKRGVRIGRQDLVRHCGLQEAGGDSHLGKAPVRAGLWPQWLGDK
jgi:hypothetical protein